MSWNPARALPPAQGFLLRSLLSILTGSPSRRCDLPCGVKGEAAERGGQWSAFYSPVPAGEGEQRLAGGRWHSGVQQWVSLDEGQDIVREISGRGEQGSYTHSCTGSWPGGHTGRGPPQGGSWLESGSLPHPPPPLDMIGSPGSPSTSSHPGSPAQVQLAGPTATHHSTSQALDTFPFPYSPILGADTA